MHHVASRQEAETPKLSDPAAAFRPQSETGFISVSAHKMVGQALTANAACCKGYGRFRNSRSECSPRCLGGACTHGHQCSPNALWLHTTRTWRPTGNLKTHTFSFADLWPSCNGDIRHFCLSLSFQPCPDISYRLSSSSHGSKSHHPGPLNDRE